ncbi:hypothetical protein CROQUDRAFT_537540 [Cronartium quercuum f. sp. fusiforme G11]|uniref:Uncharacterized protein n=1 Tax=Cronartium quercuum f. sp. fusiforme G11 TaxID=708437 RepID=A0A9P6NW70_9BASI|nr:hypothetical protein CROQUDRAFT_537540 [Cronartium quercuum f. sp. fusiforme G11]
MRDRRAYLKKLEHLIHNIPENTPTIDSNTDSNNSTQLRARSLESKVTSSQAQEGSGSNLNSQVIACSTMERKISICDPSSCRKYPTAHKCRKIDVEQGGNSSLSTEIYDEIPCQASYYFPLPDDKDNSILCVDKNMISYMCTGECSGSASMFYPYVAL